jgi:hypothetical protein
MAFKVKKETQRLMITVGGAATASYFINTFPLGDTLIGGLIGSMFGHPWIGAAVGALTPSRSETAPEAIAAAVADKIADDKTGAAAESAAMFPESLGVEAHIGDYTILARVYRDKATEAAANGRPTEAAGFMRMAEAAEAAEVDV